MKKAYFFIACIVTLFVLTCLSAFTDFFSLDEPNLLWEIRRGTAWQHYYPRFLSEGRPLYGLIQVAGLSLFDLKYLRWISLLLTVISGLIMYSFFQKKRIESRAAAALVVMMLALPGFTVIYGWAQAFPNHLSFMLSFFSGTLAYRAFAVRLGENGPSRPPLLMLSLVILLQVVSLLNYQGMALSFLLPAFFMLLLKSERPATDRLKFLGAILLLFVASLGIYYQVYKSILHGSGLEMTGRGKISADLLSKAEWFSNILINASQLHLLLLKKNILQYTFSLVVAFFIIRDIIQRKYLDTILLLIFSVLLFLPHLLIEESWTASRNFALISILFIFFVGIRVLEWFPARSSIVLPVASVLCMCLMYMNYSEGYVKPYSADYRFVNDFTDRLPDPSKGKIQIAAILPRIDLHEKYSPLKQYYDEFNLPVFFSGWPVEPAVRNLYLNKHLSCSAQQVDQLINVRIIAPGDSILRGEILLNFNYK